MKGKKIGLMGIKLLLMLSFIVPLLAACGITESIKEQYPLVSVNGSGNETSYVYRAEDQSVPEVAAAMADKKKPKQQSEESTERMFLVYSNEIIQLEQDPENTGDTLVEVNSTDYVRKNYSSDFLKGYLLASVIGDLFGSGGHGGAYRGYSSKDTYKPATSYRTPSVDDKKVAPPMTVERSGSIFRRSSKADSSVKSDTSSTSSSTTKKKESVIGKIFKDKDGSDKSSTSNNMFKKSTPKKPKVKMGRSRITRRR